MRLVLALVLVLLAGGQAAAAGPEIPAEAKAREARLLAKASPAVKTWVREEGQRVRKAGTVSESAVQAAVRARFGSLGQLNDGDIMDLAFLALMEAAKSAGEDMKSIMAEVKRINAAKAQQRAAAEKAAQRAPEKMVEKAPARMADTTVTTQSTARMADSKALKSRDAVQQKDVTQGKEVVKQKLDSMSEMGEMESLRLQMAMDRHSKFMSTLSNMLKKMSDTQSSITGNLK